MLINLSDPIRELKILTSELNIKNYLAYHFIQTNLILELYLSKTSILFNVIQIAKIGLIHPSLLKPPEFLKLFLDNKVGLPRRPDLPMD